MLQRGVTGAKSALAGEGGADAQSSSRKFFSQLVVQTCRLACFLGAIWVPKWSPCNLQVEAFDLKVAWRCIFTTFIVIWLAFGSSLGATLSFIREPCSLQIPMYIPNLIMDNDNCAGEASQIARARERRAKQKNSVLPSWSRACHKNQPATQPSRQSQTARATSKWCAIGAEGGAMACIGYVLQVAAHCRRALSWP